MKRSMIARGVTLSLLVAACSENGNGAEDPTTTDALAAQGLASVDADSYVSSQYPTATQGTRAYLKVGTVGSNLHHAYLKVSVSGLTANATGISAMLVLRSQTTSANAIHAYCGTSSNWNEGTLAWSNQPGYAASAIASVSSVTAGADATFDISRCIPGNGTFTVVLDQPTGTVVQFDSREAATNKPRLSVSYTPSAPIIFGMFNNTADAPGAETNSAANFRTIADEWFVGSKMRVHRVFDSGLPVSYAKSAGADDPAHGNVSFLSVKPPNDDFRGVAAGKYDAAIQSLAATIPADSYFTMYHEPEDNMSGADFSAMFRQFYKIAKAANPRLKIGYVAMAYQWRSGSPSTTNPDAWYPGATSTDFLAVDAYDNGFTGARSLDTQADFQRWYGWAAPKGKPILLAEYGVEDVSTGGFSDASRATVIRNSIAWAKGQSQIKMILYWNGTQATPGGQNHILNPTTTQPKDTFPLARDAWNAGVTQYGSSSTVY